MSDEGLADLRETFDHYDELGGGSREWWEIAQRVPDLLATIQAMQEEDDGYPDTSPLDLMD